MTELHLKIDGMSCGHCVATVRKVLAAVPGVDVKDVQIGTANIAIDPAQVSVATLIDAVQDAGYDAREDA
jgi:copper chaperone